MSKIWLFNVLIVKQAQKFFFLVNHFDLIQWNIVTKTIFSRTVLYWSSWPYKKWLYKKYYWSISYFIGAKCSLLYRTEQLSFNRFIPRVTYEYMSPQVRQGRVFAAADIPQLYADRSATAAATSYRRLPQEVSSSPPPPRYQPEEEYYPLERSYTASSSREMETSYERWDWTFL